MRDLSNEVLVEFWRVGNAVKVSAVDPVTMKEVCIQGSVHADEEVLRRAAVRKLRYVLRRNVDQP